MCDNLLAVADLSKGDVMKNMVYAIVCLYSTVSFGLHSQVLQKELVPGQRQRLQISTIENTTDMLSFQVFSGGSSSLGLVLPMSTLTFANDKNHHKPIHLYQKEPFMIKCIKGSYMPVYIQDGDLVGGNVEPGYEGPYYLSMWLRYPQVAESSKLHIRYLLKKGKIGKIGVKIGQKGDYRLVAHENVKFI